MAAAYSIPAASLELTEEIKKSRFITLIAHTPTVEVAKGWVNEIKRQHPTARHHCWAFVAGAPQDSQVYGFSDDGEPSGTAGKPILAQLMGSGLGEICAVVVRYYGGIQLGTGGLVKAYGGGVGGSSQAAANPAQGAAYSFLHSLRLWRHGRGRVTDKQSQRRAAGSRLRPAGHPAGGVGV